MSYYTSDYTAAAIDEILASVDYATLTEKLLPYDNDMILLQDSQADGAPKKAKIANLPGGGGGQCEILNWYMPAPINQRGIVSGTTISTPGYFLDGWKLVSGSCIWTVGQRLAIANESVVVQYMEKFYGGMLDKTYTFSIDTSDGIKSVTFNFPAAVSGATVYAETGITGYCTIKAGFEYRSGGEIICGTTQYYVPYIEITATDDIAITPYLEAHNVSTMANVSQPDFAKQLAQCKRFLARQNLWLLSIVVVPDFMLFDIPHELELRGIPSLVASASTFSVDNQNGAPQTGFSFNWYGGDEHHTCISASKVAHGCTSALMQSSVLLSAEL